MNIPHMLIIADLSLCETETPFVAPRIAAMAELHSRGFLVTPHVMTPKCRQLQLNTGGKLFGDFFFCVWGFFFLDSGLDTFCMLFPAFRSWKLLRPNVFTAFWSSMLSFSVLFATFWTFCMLLPAFWSWK